MLKQLGVTVFAAALALQSAAGAYSPARFVDGPLPPVPIGALGGGEVFLEVHIATDGRADAITTLRTTPPFTVPLLNAVWRWHFQPATDPTGAATASRVLVAALYRPPALLGPTLGQPPTDVGSPSNELPFPQATVMPDFPPTAIAAGNVLLEAQIDATGRPDVVAVIRGTSPFSDSAQTAAKRWQFRPGSVDGVPARTVAYLVFGFPVPVVVGHAPMPVW